MIFSKNTIYQKLFIGKTIFLVAFPITANSEIESKKTELFVGFKLQYAKYSVDSLSVCRFLCLCVCLPMCPLQQCPVNLTYCWQFFMCFYHYEWHLFLFFFFYSTIQQKRSFDMQFFHFFQIFQLEIFGNAPFVL